MKINTYIKNSNMAFEIATSAHKRTMIAQDVIYRINRNNIHIVSNILLDTPDTPNDIEGSFKEYINSDNDNECKVCAKGALFVSITGRVNKATIYDCNYHNNDSYSNLEGTGFIHNRLKEYFSIYQLDMIETAFEGYSCLNILTHIDHDKCINYHRDSSHTEENHLIGICRNIIKNKGDFIP